MSAVPQPKAGLPAQDRFLRRFDSACEWAIAGLVAVAVLWGPLAFGGIPPAAFLVVQGLTMVALGLWALRMWTRQPARLFWSPVCWAVLVFLLYALVRCRLVIIEYIAREELVHVIVYAVLFFLIVNNFNHRISVMGIAFCLIALGVVLSWMALFQYVTRHPTVWGFPRREQFMDRGAATYINPDHLAGLLDMTIPLALAFAFLSRFSAGVKILFGYCALSMLAGIAVTLSRGGILATLAALVVFGLIRVYQKGHWLPALAGATVVIALGIAFDINFGALQHRFELAFGQGRVVDVRTSYWPSAVHIFQDHPWWGGGPGHFDSEFAKYRPAVVQIRPMFAHNDYLNTLAEWGVTGLGLILVTCVFLWHGAIKTWRALFQPDSEGNIPQKSDKAALLIGACIGVLAILFHSVVDFNMHVPANAVVAVTLMALITLHIRFVSENYWKKPGVLGKIPLTLVMLGGIAWLGSQEVRAARAACWFSRFEAETASPDSGLGSLKKAYAAEPMNYIIPYDIGEHYRLISFQGDPGYEVPAREALPWYAKSMALNPLDAYVPMRYGMTLDWLGETNQSGAYFDLAEKLDPNNSHVAYYVGRHYLELDDIPSARRWFQRSLHLHWNDLAFFSLRGIEDRLAEPYGLYKK